MWPITRLDPISCIHKNNIIISCNYYIISYVAFVNREAIKSVNR